MDATGLRYILAFAVPLVGVSLSIPFAARLATRKGIVDRPSTARFNRRTIPYLGGLPICVSLICVAIVVIEPSAELLVVVLAALAIFAVGLLDDRSTVSPAAKLLVETAGALAFWAVGIRAEIFGIYGLDLVVTVAWTIGVTNAFNLIDNMDGLASGIAAISGITFFGIAAYHADVAVACLCLALAGANLGFLRFNFPPAKIFMGDAGALLNGFVIAGFALESQLAGQQGSVWVVVPLMAVGLPLIDMTYVVVSRTRAGKPFYVGGTDHTSHRLSDLGLSPEAIVGVMYAMQGTLSALALWAVIAEEPYVLAAAPLIVGLAGLALWRAVIAPRRSDQGDLEVIDLDVIDLTLGESDPSIEPAFMKGKRGA